MGKVKLIFILAAIGLLLMPTAVWAQPKVCRFYGEVTLNGEPVSSGTIVRAWVEGEMISETKTVGSGYEIDVPPGKSEKSFAGKTVKFTIKEKDIPAGSTSWEAGGTKNFDLAATTTPTASASLTLSPEKGVGAVVIEGNNFTPVSEVTIKWEGDSVATVPGKVKTDSDGGFSAMIAVPTTQSGDYQITATDGKRSDRATFRVVASVGITNVRVGKTLSPDEKARVISFKNGVLTLGIPKGEPGPKGEKGEPGKPGRGAPGGPVLPIVAIVLSVLAIFFAFKFRPRLR